jgi:hypothetical protein
MGGNRDKRQDEKKDREQAKKGEQNAKKAKEEDLKWQDDDKVSKTHTFSIIFCVFFFSLLIMGHKRNRMITMERVFKSS